jgi:hypothetical protein
MVSDPSSNPNFEQKKFNAALQPSLTVVICLLKGAPVDALGSPLDTDCVDPPFPFVKIFPAGTIRLQGGTPDGFYQVLWHTQESNLDVTKFYRIKVMVEGSDLPFGVADIDPVANMKEFRNARTGEVIPLNDDSTLPINFRIEHGGGPTLCGTATLCNSATVTNFSPTGLPQIVTVDGGAGAIAGASFPDGWLPTGTGRPQSVVVTIRQVDVGTTNRAAGTESNPCHLGLTLMQFPGCFNFTTTPPLQPINSETTRQFVNPVTGAVCYVLHGTGDPRENFAEMYASGPTERPHALDDVTDIGILSPGTRNCSPQVFAAARGNGLTQLASAGWRKIKSGLGQLFGVKTAYGVDLGLGGFMTEFSNVGAVVPATIQGYGATTVTFQAGLTVGLSAIVIGNHVHQGEGSFTGIKGVPVTFSVEAGNGRLAASPTAHPSTAPVTVNTGILAIPNEGGGFTYVDGVAGVMWTPPANPGTYTMTASAPTSGGSVTYTATVTGPISQATLIGTWENVNSETQGVVSITFGDNEGLYANVYGACEPTPCNWGSAPVNTDVWDTQRLVSVSWYSFLGIPDPPPFTKGQTILYLPETDQLQVTTFTDFTPADGRTDYTLIELFRRAP